MISHRCFMIRNFLFSFLSISLLILCFSSSVWAPPTPEEEAFYTQNARTIRYNLDLGYCKKRHSEAQGVANAILNQTKDLTDDDVQLIINWASLKTIAHVFEQSDANKKSFLNKLIVDNPLFDTSMMTYAGRFDVLHYLYCDKEGNITEDNIRTFLNHLVWRDASSFKTLIQFDKFKTFLGTEVWREHLYKAPELCYCRKRMRKFFGKLIRAFSIWIMTSQSLLFYRTS